jgi:subtilase family serine protease
MTHDSGRRRTSAAWGVVVLLGVAALAGAPAAVATPAPGSRGAGPSGGAATAQASPPRAYPPIRYASVAAPTRPDKPGKGSTSTSVTYPPAVIQSAYDFGSFASSGGTGTTVAIVDAYGDPTLASDLHVFDQRFGLPSATVTVSYPDGTPTSANSSWAVETALDVEWAHANAPEAAIDLVVVPDATFEDLLDGVAAAVGLKPTALSMSWGAPESDYAGSTCTVPGSTTSETCLAAYEAEFGSAAQNSTALLAASGDQGAYDGTHPRTLTVNYPASSPAVVGVGGTTLSVTSTGAWSSETAWSDSGGGFSTLFSEPSYQSSAGIPDSSGTRGVPDVAFDANPSTGVYVYEGGSWYAVGGTSVGAPNWAAIAADAAATGKPLALGALYGVYVNPSSYSADYHDIQSGSNGYYSAEQGWDAVTGIGTPQVANLAAGL